MDIETKPNADDIVTLAEMENNSNNNAIPRSILSLTPVPPPSAVTSTSASISASASASSSTSTSKTSTAKPTSATPESLASKSNEEETFVLSESNEEENKNHDEKERANQFDRGFSNVTERTCGRKEEDETDDHDVGSIASYDGDQDEENMQHRIQITHSFTESTEQQENQTEDKYEAVLIGPDDEIIDEVTPSLSLLDDDTILRLLRTSLYGTDQRSFDTANSSEGAPDDDRTASEQIQQEQQCHHNPTVAFFFKFFEFAQAKRLQKSYAAPYLTMGLFSNLCDVRSDLEWAQDAAYRRQAGKPYVAWDDYFAKERSQPWFTYVLLAVCNFLMAWAFYENDWKAEPLGTNPLFGPRNEVLLEMGALKGKALIEDGKWWLVVTAMFLHAGLIHLLLNSVMILWLCRTIERNHGWLHTALLFLLSGMLGNMISALLQPNMIIVGASGGIYGLLGACVGDIVLNSRFFFLVLEERAQKECLQRKRKRLWKEKHSGVQSSAKDIRNATTASNISASDVILEARDPVAVQSRRRRVRLWCYLSLVLDLFGNLLLGCLPFVDNFAHLGGLLFGFFVSLSSLRLMSTSFFDYRTKQEESTFGRWCHRLRIFALRCGGGLSALFLVFVAIVFLRRSDGENSPCPSCRYASCLALPVPWKPNDSSNWWTCDGCSEILGRAYWEGRNFDLIVTVDLFCPLGNTVGVDFAEKGYTKLEQAMGALPDLCREFCEWS